MTKTIAGALALALCLSWPQSMAAQESAEDQAAFFAHCGACHEVGDIARSSRVGPALTTVFGAQAGIQRGFDYSTALIEAGEDGLVWTRVELDAFIADPRGYLQGNRMAYAGQRDPEIRRDIIDYLRDAARTGGDPLRQSGGR